MTVLYRQNDTWAQIAKFANLTNPTLGTLEESLNNAAGIDIKSTGWQLKLWARNTGDTKWWARSASVTWEETLRASERWMQVRHCLSHGLVTGMDPDVWPGPVTTKKHSNRRTLATASDVLPSAANGKRSLTLYPALNAALVYSVGAAHIATAVASILGDPIDVRSLVGQFEDV